MNELQTEIETYALRESELTKEHLGKFVVIKGEKVMGFFDSIDDALTEGTRQFGLESYLVRRVGDPTQKIEILALSLGLLRANSSRSI